MLEGTNEGVTHICINLYLDIYVSLYKYKSKYIGTNEGVTAASSTVKAYFRSVIDTIRR
jgi:hypothetical protein